VWAENEAIGCLHTDVKAAQTNARAFPWSPPWLNLARIHSDHIDIGIFEIFDGFHQIRRRRSTI
jgi:hypothetical protein